MTEQYTYYLYLTENAIKYNNPGERVSITLAQSENGPSVSVTDTGVGMNDSTLSKIFLPFYLADKSRSQDIPGAGLGLSLW